MYSDYINNQDKYLYVKLLMSKKTFMYKLHYNFCFLCSECFVKYAEVFNFRMIIRFQFTGSPLH